MSTPDTYCCLEDKCIQGDLSCGGLFDYRWWINTHSCLQLQGMLIHMRVQWCMCTVMLFLFLPPREELKHVLVCPVALVHREESQRWWESNPPHNGSSSPAELRLNPMCTSVKLHCVSHMAMCLWRMCITLCRYLPEINKYRVIHSMHASYSELCDFVSYLRPKRIIPCVIPIGDTSLADVCTR